MHTDMPLKNTRTHPFSSMNGILTRIDHILIMSHQTNLKIFKKLESQSASYHNGIKLEINNKKTAGKSLNPWKLNF